MDGAAAAKDPGVFGGVFRQFELQIAAGDGTMREHVLSALGRGLPHAGRFRPHDRLMSIAAGGPSLEETWRELAGDIVGVNGSFGYLLERGLKPWATGAIHPEAHIADLMEPRQDVFYFIASICHPAVFDRLKGCKVILWHPLGLPDMVELVKPRVCVGGGSTMGLRWLTLGHLMGFRKFHCHGLDSSYRPGRTHAYPDRRDHVIEGLETDGFRTSLNFMAQVDDWFHTLAMFAREAPEDRIEVKLFGEGLLQHMHRLRQEQGR